MNDPTDPRLRFRVWINHRLIDERWIADVFQADAKEWRENVTAIHLALVAQALRDGVPWLTEVYDPAKPEEEAYTRIGTDAAGMVYPIAIALLDLSGE